MQTLIKEMREILTKLENSIVTKDIPLVRDVKEIEQKLMQLGAIADGYNLGIKESLEWIIYKRENL